ncbi:MAG: branched-chain amino acid ABC transporter permease [Sneathiella sp.]|nr:branched-chain amino acid ABC transporter permease [Sneathiella sp.]
MTSYSGNEIKITIQGIWRGVQKMFALSLFIIPFGMAFGVAAIESGMSVVQAVTMSILVFSGAAQFASMDMWSTSSYISLLLVVLAVSARHTLLGAALSPWVNKLSRSTRLSALSVLSDANFADCFSAFRAGERDVGRLVGGGLMLWATWVVGTVIGAFAGEAFGDLDRFGIDVLMPSYFAVLVLIQWRVEWEGMKTYLPAIVASFVAVLGLYLLPTGWNVVVAALSGGLVGGLTYGR